MKRIINFSCIITSILTLSSCVFNTETVENILLMECKVTTTRNYDLNTDIKRVALNRKGNKDIYIKNVNVEMWLKARYVVVDNWVFSKEYQFIKGLVFSQNWDEYAYIWTIPDTYNLEIVKNWKVSKEFDVLNLWNTEYVGNSWGFRFVTRFDSKKFEIYNCNYSDEDFIIEEWIRDQIEELWNNSVNSKLIEKEKEKIQIKEKVEETIEENYENEQELLNQIQDFRNSGLTGKERIEKDKNDISYEWLVWKNEKDRQILLLNKYWYLWFNNIDHWKTGTNNTWIDMSFIMCIWLVETKLWKYKHWKNNVGNLWWKEYENEADWIKWITDVLNNEYLKVYDEVKLLSRYWNEKGSIFSDDKELWHKKIIDCITFLKWFEIEDNYNFRIN